MIRCWTTIFIMLLVAMLLETALLSNILFLPAVPDLLLLIVLYLSVYNGSLMGESAGFISGLLLDFLTAAPLGMNCLLRTLLGFIAGLCHTVINVSGILIPCLLALVSTLVKFIVIEFISFFFPTDIITYELVSMEFGAELLLNVVLAPVMFKFLSLFSAFLIDGTESPR